MVQLETGIRSYKLISLALPTVPRLWVLFLRSKVMAPLSLQLPCLDILSTILKNKRRTMSPKPDVFIWHGLWPMNGVILRE